MQEILNNTKENNNKSTPVSLDSLDDDSLKHIFERINELPHQVQVAKVCKRFYGIVLGIWKCKPENRILTLDNWSSVLPNTDDLKLFLHAMRKHFHTVRLIDDCLNAFLKEMEELGIKQLPGVQRCELQDNALECYPNDEEIESLTKLLPNLKYLSLNSPITGCFISKFKYLEELHLYHVHKKIFELTPEYLNELLLNLRNLRVLDIRDFEASQLTLSPDVAHCTRLQELKLNLNTLKSALDYVLMMPQLKSLKVLLDQNVDTSRISNGDIGEHTICGTDELFHILHEKSVSIIGLGIDMYFMPLSQDWDSNFSYFSRSNLKLLALCNCHYSTEFFERYTCMTRLEILCLRHAPFLKNQTVLKFLEACPNLRLLDISFCSGINKSLLPKIAQYLNEQKRNHTLLIYYCFSGLELEIRKNLAYWSNHKYIELHDDLPPNSDVGLSYVCRGFQLNFDPTVMEDSSKNGSIKAVCLDIAIVVL